MARILIVEDQEQHMKNAVAVAEEMGHSVICASFATEAENIISEGGIDAVVTDVHIPLHNSNPWNHSESPCGINVAAAAKEASIPCVFCTNDNHHGAKVQWLKSLVEYGGLGLPRLVGDKNWAYAMKIVFEPEGD